MWGSLGTKIFSGNKRGTIRYALQTAIDKTIVEFACAPAELSHDITSFNDHPKVTKTLIAKVWNRAMALLGYTEGNPEAKFARGRQIAT
jgi:hypothetical protein